MPVSITHDQTIARQYWRCLNCLLVWATEGELDHGPMRRGWPLSCPACDQSFAPSAIRYDAHPLEHMGTVHTAGVMEGEEKTKSPCNGTCTHAHGPECNCSCGGVNHGTGLVIRYREEKAEPTPDQARELKYHAQLASYWHKCEARLITHNVCGRLYAARQAARNAKTENNRTAKYHAALDLAQAPRPGRNEAEAQPALLANMTNYQPTML